ncbi:hypothetical protein ED208_11050 [Stagnimonas aquatica]|uniref:Lipoprotein n=1 Tax=Stagnimonas aquatica TaxID=2689987 RepID=A0A3N0VA42_9GAMM|nr:hypothetical protein [Stagnimonas aquatica]ROH89653.1 hypothetical protein ED208_11050 [Stagnimonas aquatica]
MSIVSRLLPSLLLPSLLLLSLLAACDSGTATDDGSALPPPAGDSLYGRFEGGSGGPELGIAGLYYQGSGYAARTEDDGSYRHLAGDRLRWQIGDVLLGETAAGPLTSPYALAGNCDFDAALVRLARLLLSLDRDADPDNGLQLPAIPAAAAPRPLMDFSEDELAERVRAWLGAGRGLVEERAAVDSFVRVLDGERWEQTNREEFRLSAIVRSQGLSTDGSGWVFSWQNGLQRTGEAPLYLASRTVLDAIPAELRAAGSDHIGDTDILDDRLYAPVENAGYTNPLILVYDPATLAYLGEAYPLAPHQAHVAWIALDGARRLAYSGDWDPMPVVNVYALDQGFALLRQIPLSEPLSRVQGGKVYQGALYLSRDDEANSVYKVNLDTGTVLPLFSLESDLSGQLGEMEGLAFRDLDDGSQLHTLELKASYLGANFRHHRRSQPPPRQRWCGAPGS